MIPQNELRIGNTVTTTYQINAVDAICAVAEILADSVNLYSITPVAGKFTNVPFDEIMPIPLTPGILEKCGFELEPEGYYVINGMPVIASERADYFGDINKREHSISISESTNLVITPEGYYYTYNTDPGYGSFVNCKCPYLHQLQNLYFALTQTELEINL